MSRRDRLIILIAYLAVFAVLFVIVAALGASVGPIELTLLLLLAVPLAILMSRALRSLLLRNAQRRT